MDLSRREEITRVRLFSRITSSCLVQRSSSTSLLLFFFGAVGSEDPGPELQRMLAPSVGAADFEAIETLKHKCHRVTVDAERHCLALV